MLKTMGVAFAIGLIVAPLIAAQPVVEAHRVLLKGANGERTVVITGPTGQVVGYQYDKNNLLTVKKWGTHEVHYTYNSAGLLAYATDNHDGAYSITRDREQRIVMINGAKQVKISYAGQSAMPTDITVTTLSGQTSKPVFLGTRFDSTDLSMHSLQNMDQKLATIFEAPVCPNPNDCGNDGNEGGDTGGSSGGGGTSGGGGGGGGSGGSGGDGGSGGGGGSSGGDDGDCTGDNTTDAARHNVDYNTLPAMQKRFMATIKAASCPVPPANANQQCVENCDNMYDQLITQCQRIYPGATTNSGDKAGRQLCYSQAMGRYSVCLNDC
jgi:hypothetical protein